MNIKKQSVLVVCHDAGGAEVVSAWVRKNLDQYNFLFLLEGPAVAIFDRKISVLNNIRDARQLNFRDIDWVLTSTSWASDFERNIIKYTKDTGISVVTYLDHWRNYKERFLLNSHLTLPDEIWVGDIDAKIIADRIFPSSRVSLVKNEYFSEVRDELSSVRHKSSDLNTLDILYVSEPIAAHAREFLATEDFYRVNEMDILRRFIDFMRANMLEDSFSQLRLNIRMHPAEKHDKYLELLNDTSDFSISLSKENSLVEAIAMNDWVVGITSMALVVATFAKKRVISLVEQNSGFFFLPSCGIEHWKLV